MALLAKEYWAISWSTSLLILPFLLLTPFFSKRYGARWQYIAWLCLVCHLLVPFVPVLPLAQAPIDLMPAQTVVTPFPASQALISTTGTVLEKSVIPSASPILWGEILPLLWILGVAVFLSYQLGVYLIFRRRIKRMSRPAPAETLRICQEMRNTMGIKREIGVKISAEASGPLLFGLLHPVILLPEMALGPEKLHFVFKHELLHYRRGDLWWKLLLLLANALHWYNPLSYLAVRRAGQACELSCDQLVVQGKDRLYRQAYGETVLSLIRRVCHRQAPLSTYLFNGKKSLQERLRGMLDMRPKKTGTSLLVLLVAISIFLTACVSPQNETGQGTAAATGELPAWCQPMTDFEAMAEAKTLYVGDPSAVGNVLSFSPLKEYNYTGMSLQTDTEPYGITLNYIIAQPNLYSPEEITEMAYLTAMNCFVLIDNVGTVTINVENYYTEDGKIEPLHRRDGYTFNRVSFNGDYKRDVREFAAAPSLWRQAVENYINNGIKTNWNTWKQDQKALEQLQKEVDNGHMPGLLDPQQAARQFVDQLDMLKSSIVSPVSGMEVVADEAEYKIYSYIRENGSVTQVFLTQPVTQGETGIWQVLYYRDLVSNS